MASAVPRMVVLVAATFVLLLCLGPQRTAAARAALSAPGGVPEFEVHAGPLLREVTGPLGPWPPCSPACEACKSVCASECRSTTGYCFEQCLFNDRCYSKGG
ncbi:hypothetical protein HU200_047788 [Digitaria exilis]|uniref:Uncharacterized protein n=1 Tax=Digitaria exilis TaxID=1010633 RepID=A0A835EDM2_9POAL|nr:hypothetical protein HU200_047788 [Digitaria exilis]